MQLKGFGEINFIYASHGIITVLGADETNVPKPSHVKIIARALNAPLYPDDLTTLYEPGDVVKFKAEGRTRGPWVATELVIIQKLRSQGAWLVHCGHISRVIQRNSGSFGFIISSVPSLKLPSGEIYFHESSFVKPEGVSCFTRLSDVISANVPVQYRMVPSDLEKRGPSAASVWLYDPTAGPVPSNPPFEVSSKSLQCGNPAHDTIPYQAAVALSICIDSDNIGLSDTKSFFHLCPNIVELAANKGLFH